jgi:hypothetical protein
MSASERRIAKLERENAELRHLLTRQMQTGDTLWMESGVSSRTGEPFVHIRWGDESGQLGPAEACEHAMHMLECAHAAEFDAAFVKALTAPAPGPGFDFEDAVRMLALVREGRTGDRDASLATPRDPQG